MSFSQLGLCAESTNAQNHQFFEKKDALDGKNIICKKVDKVDFPSSGIYGFRFVGSNVEGDYIKLENTKFIITNWHTDKVTRVTLNQVVWWSGWTLNRKTLDLYYEKPNEGSDYRCKLKANKTEYDIEMNEHMVKQQIKANELILKQKENNKI